MKAIIDRVIYDTDNATEIADYRKGYRNDFRYFTESLYKTSKGRWFLAGEGGPMTKYSKAEGDGQGYGRGIIPLSDEETMDWLEGTDHYDELEEHFESALQEA